MSNSYNLPLLEKVQALILAHPGQHEQSWFASESDRLPTEHCGTSCCIAGWTAAALGHTVNHIEIDLGWEMPYWAAEQLGISKEEANTLFFTFNNTRSLEELGMLIAKARAS